jgi:hypothetical protein
VALGGPNVFPGVLSWLGVARELTAGTPLVPVITHPLTLAEFEPEDMPRFLKDQAIRGVMADTFYETLGVEQGTFSFGGPNFLDSHGYFFDNLFGDLSTTGTGLANPSTTNSAVLIGATTCTLSSAPPSSYTAGATVQIGTGSIAEVAVIGSTAASNVVNFAVSSGGAGYPLRFSHPTSTVIETCTSPFTHKWAALNSPLGYGGAYGAQPPTHTFADVNNVVSVYSSPTYGTAPVNTYGARLYPSGVLKDISFSGNAEQLLNIRMTGDSWISVPSGTAVTSVTTNSRPVPNWNSTVVTGGYTLTSGNAYNGIGNFTVTPKRATQVYWTVQGTQNPYVIARGPLTIDGQMDWIPSNSETPLDLMLMNAQTPTTITVTNGGIDNAGTPFTLTFQMSQLANIKSKIMRHGQLIGWSNQFEAISNSTDVGGSGGLGPGTITLINSTAVYNLPSDDDLPSPRSLHLL